MADQDYDDDFTPTTAVIMLGSMNFEPVQTADILSLKIQDPEETSDILKEAAKKVRPDSLEALHILLKSSSVSSLFHESILTTFYEGMMPGMEVTVHVLPESSALAQEMPVQPADVDSIRSCIVMSGYLLQVEQENEGSWVLQAIKPSNDTDDDEDDDEEVQGPTEEEMAEEREFQAMLAKELEKES